jgi:hypothetical protein
MIPHRFSCHSPNSMAHIPVPVPTSSTRCSDMPSGMGQMCALPSYVNLKRWCWRSVGCELAGPAKRPHIPLRLTALTKTLALGLYECQRIFFGDGIHSLRHSAGDSLLVQVSPSTLRVWLRKRTHSLLCRHGNAARSPRDSPGRWTRGTWSSWSCPANTGISLSATGSCARGELTSPNAESSS